MDHPRHPDLAKLRATVYRRDAGRCVVCGGRVPLDGFGGFELSHRLPRSAARIDCPCNLATTHPGCHRTDRGAIHAKPATATAMGWTISRFDRRAPWDVPMWLPRQGWMLLDCAGGIKPAPETPPPAPATWDGE